MGKHPNKHIREAIEYALTHGWDVIEGGKSSHSFCQLRCVLGHSEHQMSIWCTPKNPENHAKQIIRKVKQCDGRKMYDEYISFYNRCA